MADISSWLPGLVGPVEIQQDGETVVAPRSKWNYKGATVTDNEANDSVDVEFMPEFALVSGAVPVETGADPGVRVSRKLTAADLDYGAVTYTGPATESLTGTESFVYVDLTAGDVEVDLPETPAFGQSVTFKIAPGTGGGSYTLFIIGFGCHVEQFPDSTYSGAAPPSPPPTGFQPWLEISEDAASVTVTFNDENWVLT